VDAPTVLAVNQGFSRRKNLTILLQAFRAIYVRERNATLVLVGDACGAGGAAEQLAQVEHLTAGVEFRGQVEHGEIARLMQEADLFVHPSLEESFGMVLVEAMAQGLPVVGGARSGAVPWVLDGGRAGLLCDVTSAQALEQTMARALWEDGTWQRLSRRGFEHAWRTFRLSAALDGYGEMYERVLRAEGSKSNRS
jgi:glycosyltransferase involved in cell wall biosynthesis